ncbi:MAG: hypothetical protein M0036_16140, partial [Desulfobacteraceae bacterium]|nr:hypothetical protein [Desulfobacteraceae bacterium]
ILRQRFDRYEREELSSISTEIYERALSLRRRTEMALSAGSRVELEKIREEIYGPKAGYRLYSEVEPELKFLQKYAARGPKRYLGRGIGIYQRGICKHLPAANARRIQADCAAFIEQHSELRLLELPPIHQRRRISSLIEVLASHAANLLMHGKGLELEKRILAPIRPQADYKQRHNGFTRFDQAPRALGMKQKAFDLMVAENCNIFREVGHYDRQWYLSDLYLKELSAKPVFALITAKYELLSKRLRKELANTCLN